MPSIFCFLVWIPNGLFSFSLDSLSLSLSLSIPIMQLSVFLIKCLFKNLHLSCIRAPIIFTSISCTFLRNRSCTNQISVTSFPSFSQESYRTRINLVAFATFPLV
uniref:Putative secreted protein n=1 Tax=Anopheles marajoara TaxID=58244 RepID=A0A2M4C9C8_9DIPT